METAFLIAGLGNPGQKYRKTRHNIGCMVVDFLAAKFGRIFRKKTDTFRATLFDFHQGTIILLKPTTYMNLSGLAISSGVEYYKIVLSNLLIICDDVNLKFGTIRIKSKGSDGGQKGLRSIITTLETQDFARLRLGIGDHFYDVADYVLSPFNTMEQKDLRAIIQIASDAILSFVLEGIELTMSRFNRTYLGTG